MYTLAYLILTVLRRAGWLSPDPYLANDIAEIQKKIFFLKFMGSWYILWSGFKPGYTHHANRDP